MKNVKCIDFSFVVLVLFLGSIMIMSSVIELRSIKYLQSNGGGKASNVSFITISCLSGKSKGHGREQRKCYWDLPRTLVSGCLLDGKAVKEGNPNRCLTIHSSRLLVLPPLSDYG